MMDLKSLKVPLLLASAISGFITVYLSYTKAFMSPVIKTLLAQGIFLGLII